jgi:hypothetical protein
MQSSFSVKINEKEKENKNNISKIKISLPIDIVNVNEYRKKTNNYDLNTDAEEYSLNFNNFDPNKASPPSEWKERLENRIKIHYSYKLEKE